MPAFARSLGPVLVYGLLSLCAVALGCVVCAVSGVPTGSWLRNLAAWAVGLGAAAGLAAFSRDRFALVWLILSLLILCASLFGEPQQGVRRWLDIGPLHINVAFIVLPMAVVSLSWNVERLWCWGLVLAIELLLAVQPDASQATAFAVALAVVALRSSRSGWLSIGVTAVAAALAAVSWLRPDPLGAVPEVEEIVALASAVSPALAILSILLVVAASAAPVATTSPGSGVRTAALALSGYMLATIVTTAFGAFPMPLLGVGMSPITGFWLGVGLLAARVRLEAGPAASPASGS